MRLSATAARDRIGRPRIRLEINPVTRLVGAPSVPKIRNWMYVIEGVMGGGGASTDDDDVYHRCGRRRNLTVLIIAGRTRRREKLLVAGGPRAGERAYVRYTPS